MSSKYSINFKRQIEYLEPLLYGLLATFLLVLFFINKNGNVTKPILFFGSLFLITGFFPVLLIHLQYYFRNTNVTLLINQDRHQFLYNDKVYEYNNIEKIEIHKSRFSLNLDIQLLPTTKYHYSKIYTKNGEIIYITSLLLNDCDFGLKDKTFYIPRIIAFIK